MKNCYDCNHCEVCRWIDKFKDKDVCDFYENGTPISDVLDKIRTEIDNALSDGMIHKKTVLGIIDKYRDRK